MLLDHTVAQTLSPSGHRAFQSGLGTDIVEYMLGDPLRKNLPKLRGIKHHDFVSTDYNPTVLIDSSYQYPQQHSHYKDLHFPLCLLHPSANWKKVKSFRRGSCLDCSCFNRPASIYSEEIVLMNSLHLLCGRVHDIEMIKSIQWFTMTSLSFLGIFTHDHQLSLTYIRMIHFITLRLIEILPRRVLTYSHFLGIMTFSCACSVI